MPRQNAIGSLSSKIVELLDTAPSGNNAYNRNWDSSPARDKQAAAIYIGDNEIAKSFGRDGSIKGGKLYELAMDNFLCETTNFFMAGNTNFQTNREENFATVRSGSVYKMEMAIYRSSNTASAVAEDKRFEMYSRATAFGAPLAADDMSLKLRSSVGGMESYQSTAGISFSHVTPPYYAGTGSVVMTFTASYDGKPTLDEILAETTLSFERSELVRNINAVNAKKVIDAAATGSRTPVHISHPGLNEDFRVNVDSSFNLLQKVQEVPVGTNELKNRWVIQSKFETPILNFAGVSTGSVQLSDNTVSGANPDGPNITKARDIITRGMWHQYGSLINDADVGVFAVINDAGENSLADVVGFEKGVAKRVGAVKEEKIVSEAIVAIPFKIVSGERRFINFPENTSEIDYTRSNTYQKMLAAMDKYIFPPSFDFTRFEGVDPIIMYIFEFSVKFTQQDLADMWQNLPPNLEERFERKNAVVQERELLDLIISKDQNVQWMVFKVKQRSVKDYDRFRRSLVTNDVSALPEKVKEPLTYNWPYDYFSIVEMAKIEEKVQYVSTDIKKLAPVSDLDNFDFDRVIVSSTGDE